MPVKPKWSHFAANIVVPLGIMIFVVVGVINLHFCSRFAELAGMNMAEIIRSWFHGIDISAQYSGKFLKALERWDTAIIEFSVPGIMALMTVSARQAMKRNARILKFIEEKSNLP